MCLDRENYACYEVENNLKNMVSVKEYILQVLTCSQNTTL